MSKNKIISYIVILSIIFLGVYYFMEQDIRTHETCEILTNESEFNEEVSYVLAEKNLSDFEGHSIGQLNITISPRLPNDGVLLLIDESKEVNLYKGLYKNQININIPEGFLQKDATTTDGRIGVFYINSKERLLCQWRGADYEFDYYNFDNKKVHHIKMNLLKEEKNLDYQTGKIIEFEDDPYNDFSAPTHLEVIFED